MPNLYDVQKFIETLPTNNDHLSHYFGKVVIEPEHLEERIALWLKTFNLYHPVESISGYKYEVNGIEVSKQEYVAAERRNGFHNTIGFPEEPATASWSNSKTGDHGRQVYVHRDTATRS